MRQSIQTTIFTDDDTEVIVQGEIRTDRNVYNGVPFYECEKNWTSAFDTELKEIEITDEIIDEANDAEWELVDETDEY